MKIAYISAFALLMVSTPAFAIMAQPYTNCGNENATVSVRFNDEDNDVSVLKEHLDKEMADIKRQAKSLNLQKFEIQNMNYNINPQNMFGRRYNQQSNAEQYNLNGTATFSVLPASKAIDVMAELTKKGFNASMNSNVFNNGCNNPMMFNNIVPPPPPPAVSAPAVIRSH